MVHLWYMINSYTTDCFINVLGSKFSHFFFHYTYVVGTRRVTYNILMPGTFRQYCKLEPRKSPHFSYYFSPQFVFRPYAEIIRVSLFRSRFFARSARTFAIVHFYFRFALSPSPGCWKKVWLMENIRRDYERYMIWKFSSHFFTIWDWSLTTFIISNIIVNCIMNYRCYFRHRFVLL